MKEVRPDPQWIEMTIWTLQEYQTSDIIANMSFSINLIIEQTQVPLCMYACMYVCVCVCSVFVCIIKYSNT